MVLLKGLSDKGLFFIQILIVRKDVNLKKIKRPLCAFIGKVWRQVEQLEKLKKFQLKKWMSILLTPYKNKIGAWASAQSEVLDKGKHFKKGKRIWKEISRSK